MDPLQVTLKMALLLAFTTATPLPQSTATTLDYRLPDDVLPVSYVVTVKPYIEVGKFIFDGKISIMVKLQRETSVIKLHANMLEIDNTTLRVQQKTGTTTDVKITNQQYDTNLQIYSITVDQPLTVNNIYEISVDYKGHLEDDMNGFYRSSYETGGETRWIAVTHFQPTHARRAFPCFDEPKFKATFQININRPDHLQSMSNMPLDHTINVENNRKLDVFKPTPVPMSTYLVAWIVSDFGSVSNTHRNFSTSARRDVVGQGTYSITIGEKMLAFLEGYTGVEYVLPKMEQVALTDFAAGAMENWGLISYRETSLLYEKGIHPEFTRQRVATVVGHELTHQWFGNLVSPEWWQYTWLSEGFATYYQYQATDHVEDGWRLMEQFVFEKMHPVLKYDSLASSEALSSACNSPEEIHEKFGIISYNKGGSIVRMIDNVLTSDVFKAGLHNYLTKRKTSTATPTDLFDALQESVPKTRQLIQTVGTLFEPWTTQAGYPLVTVTRNYKNNSAVVSQERFLLRKPEQPSTEMWWVPLTWTSEDTLSDFENTVPSKWIPKEKPSIVITDLPGKDQWVIFNNKQTGYYRVNYDEDNWNKIISALNSDRFTDIQVLNRAQLLDDSMNLARVGVLTYGLALNVTSYLSRETDLVPWSVAFRVFSYLQSRLADTDAYKMLQLYLLDQLDSLYNSVGFEEKEKDTHVDILKRAKVLEWACKVGHPECVATAQEKFKSWMESSNPNDIYSNRISPDQKKAVYCTSVRTGSLQEWQFLWKQYGQTTVAAEQVLILSALGCSSSTTQLTQYMSLSISGTSGIRKQDAASVFSAVYKNPIGVPLALDFLIKNYKAIQEYYGGMGAVGTIISSLGDKLHSKEQVDQLEQFINMHSSELKSETTAGKTAVESARANLEWKEANYQTIAEWLNDEPEKGGVAKRSTSGALMLAGVVGIFHNSWA